MIRFGPSGLGPTKNPKLKEYHDLGLKACEIPFTYGVYIKKNKHKKIIKKIKKSSKKLDIKLSIHSPYWINLNSKEKSKIKASKKRILKSCEIGEMLGAKYVVFHPGYYGDMDKEKTYENIRKAMKSMREEIKSNKWKIRLAPETTGKVNVFGSVDEILQLVKDTGCRFCVDFAHLLARNQGKKTYKEMYKPFRSSKELHCHFSGIEWTKKGEKKHKITPEAEIKKLLKVLPKKSKEITIINESPQPVKDSVRSLKIYNKIK